MKRPYLDWVTSDSSGCDTPVAIILVIMLVVWIILGINLGSENNGYCYETLRGDCFSVDGDAVCERRSTFVHMDYCVRVDEPEVVGESISGDVCN